MAYFNRGRIIRPVEATEGRAILRYVVDACCYNMGGLANERKSGNVPTEKWL